MKTLLYLCLVFIDALESFSCHGHSPLPQRTVIGTYYGQPLHSRGNIPRGSMTFASGDTIGTNSYVDLQTSAEETTEKRKISPDFEDSDEKRIPAKKPSNDQDSQEDDVLSRWPFVRNGVPSYNAFFPIMIGGATGYGRKSSDSNGENFYPGGATAIANSFSTGKGGVASSHATSFGDPYLSSLFRNYMNKKVGKSGNVEI